MFFINLFYSQPINNFFCVLSFTFQLSFFVVKSGCIFWNWSMNSLLTHLPQQWKRTHIFSKKKTVAYDGSYWARKRSIAEAYSRKPTTELSRHSKMSWQITYQEQQQQQYIAHKKSTNLAKNTKNKKIKQLPKKHNRNK